MRSPVMEPALALIELDSIAVGIETGDAMVKRAPISVLRAGTTQPGRYLVLVAGGVADVEEAFNAGREVAGPCVVDTVFLPNVHPQVLGALRGAHVAGHGDALGIVETLSMAAVIDAADAGVKGANVTLLDLRLGDGIGGKGYLLFDGVLSEVEAAVEIACAQITGDTGSGAPRDRREPIRRVIPQLAAEMRAELTAAPRFRDRIRAEG